MRSRTMTSTKTNITPEASSRICAHMNDDHAHTCHAMVVSAKSENGGGKVQNARIMTGYTLSYVSCNGDVCAMREIDVSFVPHLNSIDEVRKRLIEDHHRAMTPKFAWLVADPLTRTIAVACILLGVGAYKGRDGLASVIDSTPWVKSIIDATFGSSARFAGAVVGAWRFAFVAHLFEAIYTAYVCATILKLKTGSTMKWFVLNACVGYPIMKKVLELVAIEGAARSKRRK